MCFFLPMNKPRVPKVRATTRVRLMQLTRGAFTTLEVRHPHVASFMAQQLYEPSVSPLWAVVSDDFKCEVNAGGKASFSGFF